MAVVERRSGRSVIRRALHGDGQVENLGVFSWLPPFGRPGWVVKVVSRSGKLWFLAVTIGRIDWDVDEIPPPPYQTYIGARFDDLLRRGDVLPPAELTEQLRKPDTAANPAREDHAV